MLRGSGTGSQPVSLAPLSRALSILLNAVFAAGPWNGQIRPVPATSSSSLPSEALTADSANMTTEFPGVGSAREPRGAEASMPRVGREGFSEEGTLELGHFSRPQGDEEGLGHCSQGAMGEECTALKTGLGETHTLLGPQQGATKGFLQERDATGPGLKNTGPFFPLRGPVACSAGQEWIWASNYAIGTESSSLLRQLSPASRLTITRGTMLVSVA